MIVVTNYREYYNEKNGYYFLRVYQPIKCPACSGMCLRISGRYRRYAILSTGERVIYNLRRFYCNSCDKTHVELPDSIIPLLHYTAEAVQLSLNYPNMYPCEKSTYKRWMKRFCTANIRLGHGLRMHKNSIKL